jgi:spore coat protein H
LSLKNNFDDKSFLREKVTGDIFRNSGLAGSHTAFYTVYADYGDGPVYFGLYTLTEEVDDTVIDTQFQSGKGNLYKPDGDAASFANGSFDTS